MDDPNYCPAGVCIPSRRVMTRVEEKQPITVEVETDWTGVLGGWGFIVAGAGVGLAIGSIEFAAAGMGFGLLLLATSKRHKQRSTRTVVRHVERVEEFHADSGRYRGEDPRDAPAREGSGAARSESRGGWAGGRGADSAPHSQSPAQQPALPYHQPSSLTAGGWKEVPVELSSGERGERGERWDIPMRQDADGIYRYQEQDR